MWIFLIKFTLLTMTLLRQYHCPNLLWKTSFHHAFHPCHCNGTSRQRYHRGIHPTVIFRRYGKSTRCWEEEDGGSKMYSTPATANTDRRRGAPRGVVCSLRYFINLVSFQFRRYSASFSPFLEIGHFLLNNL